MQNKTKLIFGGILVGIILFVFFPMPTFLLLLGCAWVYFGFGFHLTQEQIQKRKERRNKEREIRNHAYHRRLGELKAEEEGRDLW